MQRTIGDKIKRLLKRYRHVTRGRFLYNKPSDKTALYSAIGVWYLLRDPDGGGTLIRIVYRVSAKTPQTPAQWARLYKDRRHREVFLERILPAINIKHTRQWAFHRLVAWEGIHAVHSGDRSPLDEGRNS